VGGSISFTASIDRTFYVLKSGTRQEDHPDVKEEDGIIDVHMNITNNMNSKIEKVYVHFTQLTHGPQEHPHKIERSVTFNKEVTVLPHSQGSAQVTITLDDVRQKLPDLVPSIRLAETFYVKYLLKVEVQAPNMVLPIKDPTVTLPIVLIGDT